MPNSDPSRQPRTDAGRKDWFWGERELIRHASRIGPYGLAVATVLQAHATRKGVCWIKLKRLCQEAGGISERQARRVLFGWEPSAKHPMESLSEIGFLEARETEPGTVMAQIFSLHDAAEMARLSEDESLPRQDCESGVTDCESMISDSESGATDSESVARTLSHEPGLRVTDPDSQSEPSLYVRALINEHVINEQVFFEHESVPEFESRENGSTGYNPEKQKPLSKQEPATNGFRPRPPSGVSVRSPSSARASPSCPIYLALAAACGIDPSSHSSRREAELREATRLLVDAERTGEDVTQAGRRWEERNKGRKPLPLQVVDFWVELVGERPPPKRTAAEREEERRRREEADLAELAANTARRRARLIEQGKLPKEVQEEVREESVTT